MAIDPKEAYDYLLSSFTKKILEKDSKAGVAKQSEIARSTITNYFSGKTPMPLDVFLKLCALYDFEPRSFLPLIDDGLPTLSFGGKEASFTELENVFRDWLLDLGNWLLEHGHELFPNADKEIEVRDKEIASLKRENELARMLIEMKDRELELWKTGKIKLEE